MTTNNDKSLIKKNRKFDYKKNPLIQKFDGLPKSEKIQFICGFIDGEGCFTVSFRKNSSPNPLGFLYFLYVGFSIYQLDVHSNVDFLHYINDTFLKGEATVWRSSGKRISNVYVLDISGYDRMKNVVFPFLTCINQVFISKSADFDLFKAVIKIMSINGHRTRNGFKKIIDIAYQMNLEGKNRKISKEDLLVIIEKQFDYLESR